MTVGVPGKVIDELWAFVCVDNDDEEGVVAFQLDGMWVPLIAADRERVASFRSMAERLNRRIEIRHFTHLADVEVIEPGGTVNAC